MMPTSRSSTTRVCSPRDWLALAVILAAAIGVMRETWQDILRVAWIDEELSYVLIAPFLILYLAWTRRKMLVDCPIRGAWLGLPIMAFGWAAHWYGYLYDPAIWRGGAVVVAGGAVVATMGTEVAKRLSPALAAMIFLIPIDPTGRYHVAGPLEVYTAQAAQNVCVVLGMDVQRQGNLLLVNGNEVTVAEACNGARMILSLFLVCYFVAFDLPLKWWVRTVLLAASPVVAIIANVVRLVPTVWMFGHASQSTAEEFHDISGWVMLVAAFGVLMGICKWMQGSLAPATAAKREDAP